MTQRRSFRLAAMVLITLGGTAAGSADPAPPTLDQLRDLMRAIQADPAPVEYHFTLTEPNAAVEGHFARRGDQSYSALLRRGQRGSLMAGETSWDGKRAYSHTGMGIVAIKSDRTYAGEPGHAMLEAQFMYPVYQAYGVSKDAKAQGREYEFRDVRLEGPNVAVATFDLLRQGQPVAQFEIWHQFDKGAWPIRTRLTRNGVISVEMSNVQFHEVVNDGKWSGFPTGYTVISPSNPHYFPAKFVVDPATIRLGDQVRRDFTIEPFPFEDCSNLDTGIVHQAKDRNWKPAGPLRFPFGEFYARVQAIEAKHPPATRPVGGAAD
jgi:hypothetical protein